MRIVAAILSLLMLGCSSCTGNNNGNGADTGSDTDTDSDTDADSDGDTDGDTDSDTDTVSDAGVWDWEDQPDAGDCSQEGCRQLTFSDEVKVGQWDVWDDWLAATNEETNIVVIDIENARQLVIPALDPGFPIDTALGNMNAYPALYENALYYSHVRYGLTPPMVSKIVLVDWSAQTQTVFFSNEEEGGEAPDASTYTDVYANHLVSSGGCGGYSSNDLCHFVLPPPTTPEMIFQAGFGDHTNIWGDVVVWTRAFSGNDIQGYNFATEQIIEVTDDDDTEYQLAGRIYGDKVVYMDLRFGDSDHMGNWNHSAVFMYDIVTAETTQITSGDSIAAYPDIHDNIIIWADYRDSANPNNVSSFAGVQIWGYNIDTSTEFQITNVLDRPKTMPRIWGDRIFVDMAKTPSGNAIYMFPLPDGAK